MGERKQRLLGARGRTILTVGIYDALSARIAERAGFELMFLSGFGVAATALGEPDYGLLTPSDTLDAARRITRILDAPLIVDGDTGYGGAANVQFIVGELVRMGAAGVILEDQTWPKRCGHMRGKSVVAAEEHAAKLRAAADAARAAPGGDDFILVGRTDARAPLGLDEAIRRAHLYREAGCDLLFVEAPQSIDEMQRVADEVPGPLLLNIVEGGDTPAPSLAEIAAMGFTHCVYAVTALLAAAGALERTLTELAKTGDSRGAGDALMGFGDFTDLVGLPDNYALDEKYRG